MSVCIALRNDYDGGELRRLAKRCRDPRQVRRLLALAAAYDGMSRRLKPASDGRNRRRCGSSPVKNPRRRIFTLFEA